MRKIKVTAIATENNTRRVKMVTISLGLVALGIMYYNHYISEGHSMLALAGYEVVKTFQEIFEPVLRIFELASREGAAAVEKVAEVAEQVEEQV